MAILAATAMPALRHRASIGLPWKVPVARIFHVVTTSCTPSRGAVLTGRYPLRNGLSHQLSGSSENWHGIGLPHRERIIPQYLKEAGYMTGCFDTGVIEGVAGAAEASQ